MCMLKNCRLKYNPYLALLCQLPWQQVVSYQEHWIIPFISNYFQTEIIFEQVVAIFLRVLPSFKCYINHIFKSYKFTTVQWTDTGTYCTTSCTEMLSKWEWAKIKPIVCDPCFRLSTITQIENIISLVSMHFLLYKIFCFI